MRTTPRKRSAALSIGFDATKLIGMHWRSHERQYSGHTRFRFRRRPDGVSATR